MLGLLYSLTFVTLLVLIYYTSLDSSRSRMIPSVPNVTLTDSKEPSVLNAHFDMIVCICIPERKPHMIRTFQKWGVDARFFDAYLKSNHTHDQFIANKFLDPLYSPYLNLGRICCHYSAIRVYEQFLESNAQTLLVFEDDIDSSTYDSKDHLNKTLSPVLKAIPEKWNYLNLSKCWDDCTNNVYINNAYWTIPKVPKCRTAIALSKEGARIIVNQSQPMTEHPGDVMIAQLIQSRVLTHAFATRTQYFVQHRQMFGSNLGNRKDVNPRMCIRV